MKYYIVGKKIKEGNLDSDSERGILNEYFELGWEYMVSHLYIKNLFSNGHLMDDDVIVTLEDRMFLYEGFWKNVMSYEEFKNKNITESVVDLCNEIQNNQIKYIPKINQNNKYENFEKDKHVIQNIKYKNISHLNTDKPYCCLHIRYRKWASYRSLSKEFWKSIIDKVESSGLNIYIFGKEAKDFANGKNIIHVNLDEYASLLNNKNCKFLIGNMSGGTLVAQTFSHNKCKNYVVIADADTYREYTTKYVYEAFYHIEAFNFSDSPTKHVILVDGVKLSENEYSMEQLMNEI